MSPTNERAIRKVIVFYEDDTRQPLIIDGVGHIQYVNTVIKTDDDKADPASYYMITMKLPEEKHGAK